MLVLGRELLILVLNVLMIDAIVDFKAVAGNNKLGVVDLTSRFVDLTRIFVDIVGEVVGRNLVVYMA